MSRLVLVVGLVATVFAPSVSALPFCDAVTTWPDAPVYVVASASDPEVWKESNGLAGFQREPCEDAEGQVHAADSRTLAIHVPGPGELPCRLQGRWVVCDV